MTLRDAHRPAAPAELRNDQCPAAADDVTMPAHDRFRGNQQPQAPAPRFGYHGEQGREQGTVCPVQPRATWPPPLQDGELMAKDQDLRGLPRILAPGQPQPRFDPRDQEEHEPQAHHR